MFWTMACHDSCEANDKWLFTRGHACSSIPTPRSQRTRTSAGQDLKLVVGLALLVFLCGNAQ